MSQPLLCLIWTHSVDEDIEHPKETISSVITNVEAHYDKSSIYYYSCTLKKTRHRLEAPSVNYITSYIDNFRLIMFKLGKKGPSGTSRLVTFSFVELDHSRENSDTGRS